MDHISMLLASLPDREAVVVELWVDDAQLAEISAEGHELTIQFFPHPSGEAWTLGWTETLTALTAAGARLLDDAAPDSDLS